MATGPLVVTYPLTARSRAIVEEELGGTAEAIYLVDLAPAARAHALGRAAAVLSLRLSAMWRNTRDTPTRAIGKLVAFLQTSFAILTMRRRQTQTASDDGSNL